MICCKWALPSGYDHEQYHDAQQNQQVYKCREKIGFFPILILYKIYSEQCHAANGKNKKIDGKPNRNYARTAGVTLVKAISHYKEEPII